MIRSERSLWIGRTVALLLVLQMLVVEAALIRAVRFPQSPSVRTAIALAAASIYIVAARFMWNRRHSRIGWISVTAAIIFTARFYAPVLLAQPSNWPVETMAATDAPDLTAYLRELAAAEEQYRLSSHTYTSDPAQLAPWLDEKVGKTSIRIRGDSGFAASASDGRNVCSIWIRDTLLRHENDVEGSPTCGEENRGRHQGVRTVVIPYSSETGFTRADVSGTWVQHRADERRTATLLSHDSSAFTWTTRIAGPIRSSVAVAGNQVFVGAHANGETVGLRLSSGSTGFRVRSPNWVHHEPVITPNAVIFGFGNNEPSPVNPGFAGSAPNGVVAYDRLTGRQLWRRTTRGSVMGSPVLWKDVVAAGTGGNEAIAWRVSDGRELWRVPLPGYSPMANPLLHDSLFILGVEPATLCAIEMSTGRKVYCHAFSSGRWGAGHASAAVAGPLVLQVYEDDPEGTGGPGDSPQLHFLRRILGLPPRRYYPRPPDSPREQILVAMRIADGKEVWRVKLGPGTTSVPGHNAGTPTVEGDIAFVPSPVNRRVIAVDLRDGRRLWSAQVNPSRGSVVVVGGSVMAATRDGGFVVLDAKTGALKCRERLPAVSDRAGIVIAGETGILTLLDGTVMARPLAAWLACQA